ncbi:MAG TPA: FadR/GntR family transcriptional regulator [Sphingomicrobium sp.]|nr:FadR/GntR family transcriptional regulator [Sphingomicrobium sp.]
MVDRLIHILPEPRLFRVARGKDLYYKCPVSSGNDISVGAARNLTRSTLEALGLAIVIGRYDSRSFPTEAEIAKTLGVSRSVTREAVKMLTAKGLVSARPRHGTVVEPPSSWNLLDPDVLRWTLERKFSLELLRHFNELRMAIEPEAAALAARRHQPDDLRPIYEGLRRMEAAATGPDDALQADISFHVAILQATKNPFYAQFRTLVAAALKTSISFTNRIKGHSASVADHAAVAEAIERRDPDAARKAMATIVGEVLGLIDEADTSAAEH